jgi:hypothetical protein
MAPDDWTTTSWKSKKAAQVRSGSTSISDITSVLTLPLQTVDYPDEVHLARFDTNP